jgi:hypothetical protein
MKVKILVTVSMDSLDGGNPIGPLTTAAWKASAVEAVQEALEHAMNRGFNHPLSDDTSIFVEKVKLAPAKRK